MTEREHRDLIRKLEEDLKRAERIAGGIDQLLATIKDKFGVGTDQEAESLLAKMIRTNAKLEQSVREQEEQYENTIPQEWKQ